MCLLSCDSGRMLCWDQRGLRHNQVCEVQLEALLCLEVILKGLQVLLSKQT